MTKEKLRGKFNSGKVPGKGKTKAQMLKAPRGCLYVWCNEDTRYPKQLAEHLGRQDLQIVSPNWLLEETKIPVMLDHATPLYLNDAQMKAWMKLVDQGKGIL